MLFRVGWFVASPVGAPFMTPGAGTAHVVGRVACRRMRAGRRLIVVLWRPVCGTASVIRASQVAPLRLWRLNVVSRWLVCGVARGAPFMTPGAGTAQLASRVARRRMRAGRWLVCCFASADSRHFVGHPGVTSGAPTFAAVECCFASVIRASRVAPLRLRVVECCFAAVIRASQVAPLRLRAVECGFASVIRASQVAPLRLRVVDCCFAGGCWRRNEGLSGEGDGYEKRSRTDVAVSVWLLVVAEARLERTTSRL